MRWASALSNSQVVGSLSYVLTNRLSFLSLNIISYLEKQNIVVDVFRTVTKHGTSAAFPFSASVSKVISEEFSKTLFNEGDITWEKNTNC